MDYNTKIKIGKYESNTRILFPAMLMHKSVNGQLNDEILNHYKKVASHKEVGIIVIEYGYTSIVGKANPYQLSLAEDYDKKGYSTLVKEIKKINPNVLLIAQICHAGYSTSRGTTGFDTIAPSPINEAKEMTKEDINNVEMEFIESTKRVFDLGFDGVEIHSAHGYLLNEFYSPLTNKRTDEYGGNLNNRIRIHLEIIDSIRKLYPNKILSIRFGGSDYKEGGSTILDACLASKMFEEHGVDLIDTSGGIFGYQLRGVVEPGWFSGMTEEIKKNVSIPVVLTGGITTTLEAEEFLEMKKCDIVGIGRAIFKVTL